MVDYNKFNSFVEAEAEKKIDLSSAGLTVALCDAAHAPVATNSILANLTQISYTNLSSRVITVTSSGQTGGTYKLVLVDLVLTASGAVGPFQYVVIYDDGATNDDLICWYNYGSEVTLASGETFTINFDPDTGVLQIV
jgi:hypothetical protein